jgi:hypothetical protein
MAGNCKLMSPLPSAGRPTGFYFTLEGFRYQNYTPTGFSFFHFLIL